MRQRILPPCIPAKRSRMGNPRLSSRQCPDTAWSPVTAMKLCMFKMSTTAVELVMTQPIKKKICSPQLYRSCGHWEAEVVCSCCSGWFHLSRSYSGTPQAEPPIWFGCSSDWSKAQPRYSLGLSGRPAEKVDFMKKLNFCRGMSDWSSLWKNS